MKEANVWALWSMYKTMFAWTHGDERVKVICLGKWTDLACNIARYL